MSRGLGRAGGRSHPRWGQKARPPHSPAARHTHFLWLSVRVMPWADTLKCTTVDKGGGSWTRVMLRAFWMAWWPVRDSISTEFRYHTLQAGRHGGSGVNASARHEGPGVYEQHAHMCGQACLRQTPFTPNSKGVE